MRNRSKVSSLQPRRPTPRVEVVQQTGLTAVDPDVPHDRIEEHRAAVNESMAAAAVEAASAMNPFEVMDAMAAYETVVTREGFNYDPLAPAVDAVVETVTPGVEFGRFLPDTPLTAPARAIGEEIVREYLSAREKHAGMRGPHEGWAVIYEEFVVELGAHVWSRNFDRREARKEAIQTAAMALAFALEVCGE